MKTFRVHYFVKYLCQNSFFFFLHPVEKLVYWVPSCSPICDSGYFSAKQPSAAAQRQRALSLRTLTQQSQCPCTCSECPLWLLEVQKKAKGEAGLRCWVSTLPTLGNPTQAGPEAATGPSENTQQVRNSACLQGLIQNPPTATGFNRLWMGPQYRRKGKT